MTGGVFEEREAEDEKVLPVCLLLEVDEEAVSGLVLLVPSRRDVVAVVGRVLEPCRDSDAATGDMPDCPP